MGRNLATDMAPPFVLVAHYFIAGAIFYTLSAFLLPFYSHEISGYFLSTSLASLLHLYLLGFVMMIIFGAMYQLVPVVLEIPIFSKDFAYIQFYMFVTGILIFTFGLGYVDFIQIVPYGALMIYLSILVFIINIFLTYKQLKRWDIVAKFIFVSNIFLLIGVSIGFLLALNLLFGFNIEMLKLVQAHIALSVFGYIIMTIMGVGMVLIPMFSLSHGFSQKAINIAFYTIVSGMIFFLIGDFWQMEILKFIGFFLCCISIFSALYQMWIIFSTRIRKKYDFWAKNMVASFITLLLSFAILLAGVLTQEQRFFILFGYTLFFGFFTFFIVGHIYKILPFLVWYQRYSSQVGKMKVPMLNEMIKEKMADYQFWITLIGLILSMSGILGGVEILFQIGALIMAIGTFLVIYNIYFTLNYSIGKTDK